MIEQRYSDNDTSRRDIPSFIEPRPPLIQNPFMRPRPEKGITLFEEEDDEVEDSEILQVYLRMKPSNIHSNLYEVRNDKNLVTFLDTATAGHGRRTQHNVPQMYTFSRIFKSVCSQREVFDVVVKNNLKKLPEGQSFTLLTYGASGSGKTYTLMGTVTSPGLVPLSLEYIFKLVDAAQTPIFKPSDNGTDQLSYDEQKFELQWVQRLRQLWAPQQDKYRRMSAQLRNDLTVSNVDLTNRTKYYVWVSFVEIYNEAIYDLLMPPEKRVKMSIREDSAGNVYVKGVTHAFVRSGDEAYDVMVAGKHNRVVAATGIHANSSRSHCIFTISLLTENDEGIRTSHVRLCDLAGSERQRAAGNTGSRMVESRAINSSLHVLERCLHTLRRKQRTHKECMVPYRESKLTRLLGSALSGSRGEAISMVVTLDPSPRYANETKQVLSLAVVARDIQINNTTYASTLSSLESSTQDTTVCGSAELMRLRAENERLHFELLQAEARNKELLASMGEAQQQTADTMRELVEEAKDMTRQYYEAQIQALKSEMKDMVEDYESQLAKQSQPPVENISGTPSKFAQKEIALLTEITVLQEKLSEAKLACERAEKEVQYLRSCIEDRDDKELKESSTEARDNVVLLDSEHESDDDSDPFNESLEPVFKKSCLNRSHCSHKDLKISRVVETHNGIDKNTIDEVEYESDKSNDTLQNNDSIVIKEDSLYETDDETDIVNDDKGLNTRDSTSFNKTCGAAHDKDVIVDSKAVNKDNSVIDDANIDKDRIDCEEFQESIEVQDIIEDKLSNIVFKNNLRESNIDKDRSDCEELFHESIKVQDEVDDKLSEIVFKKNLRGTYFVESGKSSKENNEDLIENPVNGNEMVQTASSSNKKADIYEPKANKETKSTFRPLKQSETLMSKIMKSFKISQSSDSSLAQFEQLEIAANVDNSKDQTMDFVNPKMMKEKKHYFDDSVKDELNPTAVTNKLTGIEKPITKAETSDENIKYQALVVIEKQKAADNVEVKSDKNIANLLNAAKIQKKTTDFNDGKVYSLTNAAKRQEQRLFTDSPENISEPVTNTNQQQKSKYFDDKPDETTTSNEVIISGSSTYKQRYFDDIDCNINAVNKKVNDIIIHSIKDQARSPSIVKDDINEEVMKPSVAIKKILGESFAKSSTNKSKAFVKKHESVDIFESPMINFDKAKDGNDKIVAPHTTPEKVDSLKVTSVARIKELNNVDVVRKSIERLVLDHKARADIKQEIKSEPTNLIEKSVSNTIESVTNSKEDQVALTTENVNDTTNSKENNTIDEFENICKDLTNIRPTEFDLLVSQEINTSDAKDSTSELESETTFSKKDNKKLKKEISERNSEETKYNLRQKGKSILSTSNNMKKDENVEVILAQSHSKCEKASTKRCLRLRRRNNVQENPDLDDADKLKDIINLKKEFSDVTLGLPAAKKEVKDIPSPEKLSGAEENLPPMTGIQSCPSKMLTRSRRKLFTPRAEPLEESLDHAGDSNERIYVPRPSYHRSRARRKL